MVKPRLLITLLCAIALIACATAGKAPSPEEKLIYFYSIFNAQYEDYLSMAKMENLTEGQKSVMRFKKPVLETLMVLLPICDEQVKMGVPSIETEQQIYDYLNKLQGVVPLN